MNPILLYTEGSTKKFVSVWQTDKVIIDPITDRTIRLPLIAAGTYNFRVDWGDGSTNIVTTSGDSNSSHLYASAGTYTITITGIVNVWQHSSDNQMNQKILSVKSWGPLIIGTNQGGYFQGCSNLNLNNVTDILNTRNVTSFFNIFFGCASLTGVNRIAEWNISNVITLSSMFNGCTSYNNPEISNLNTSSVNTFSGVFQGCTIFNQPLTTNGNIWNVSNCTGFGNMFNAAPAFNQSLNSWNVSKCTNFSNMFFGATAFNNGLAVGVSGNMTWTIITTANTTFSAMFENCSSFNQNLNSWITTRNTSLNSTFQGCTKYNQPLNNWDTSLVTDMSGTFLGTSIFDQDVSTWNTSNVTTFSGTFQNAVKFNHNINNFSLVKATAINLMFSGATLFNNGLAPGVSGVMNLTLNTTTNINASNMFTSCVSFNQDISGWNTSKITALTSTFSGCTVFNQPIGSWNISSVTSMSNTFTNTSAFNQPLSNWERSGSTFANVTTVFNMFNGSAFNQNIGNWNVSAVTVFGNFLASKTFTTFSGTNLDAIYNGWINNPLTTINAPSFGTAKQTQASIEGRALLTRTNTTVAITSSTQSGTLVLITATNSLVNGNKVFITGISTGVPNGSYIVSNATSTNFTINLTWIVNGTGGTLRTGYGWSITDGLLAVNTVTASPTSPLIRITTTPSAHGFSLGTGGPQIFIYGNTGSMVLNGVWSTNVISTTTIDLLSSSFTGTFSGVINLVLA